MGKKTFALLDALTRTPLDSDQCHRLAANRLPWLLRHGHAEFLVALRGWPFYVATDKGVRCVDSGWPTLS